MKTKTLFSAFFFVGVLLSTTSLVSAAFITSNDVSVLTWDEENRDVGFFSFDFELSWENDIDFSLTTFRLSSGTWSEGVAFDIETSGGISTSTGSTSASVTHLSGGIRDGDTVHIPEGVISRFRFDVEFTPSQDGFYRTEMRGASVVETDSGSGVTFVDSIGSMSRTDYVFLRSVPEPSVFAMIGLGIIPLLCRRKRH